MLERAAAYTRIKKFHLAEKDFSKVIRTSPDNPYANYNKAAILVRQSKVNKALPLIEKALKVDSDLTKIAREDPAFRKIRTNPKFKRMVN